MVAGILEQGLFHLLIGQHRLEIERLLLRLHVALDKLPQGTPGGIEHFLRFCGENGLKVGTLTEVHVVVQGQVQVQPVVMVKVVGAEGGEAQEVLVERGRHDDVIEVRGKVVEVDGGKR